MYLKYVGWLANRLLGKGDQLYKFGNLGDPHKSTYFGGIVTQSLLRNSMLETPNPGQVEGNIISPDMTRGINGRGCLP